MAATVPGQMFSRPENDGHIMTSWERFLSGDETGSDALRRLIDDSWRRCYGASVDPARHRAPEPLGEHSLHSLRDECGELLTASAPVMASPAVWESPIWRMWSGRPGGRPLALSGTPARVSAPHRAARQGAASRASSNSPSR